MKRDYASKKQKYKLDQVSSELPICVVVYFQYTKKAYIYQYLLTSIFNQNYSNFKVVIAFDNSDTTQLQKLNETLYYYNGSKVEVVVNQQEIGYWSSLSNAINKGCGNAEVIALMNGND